MGNSYIKFFVEFIKNPDEFLQVDTESYSNMGIITMGIFILVDVLYSSIEDLIYQIHLSNIIFNVLSDAVQNAISLAVLIVAAMSILKKWGLFELTPGNAIGKYGIALIPSTILKLAAIPFLLVKFNIYTYFSGLAYIALIIGIFYTSLILAKKFQLKVASGIIVVYFIAVRLVGTLL